MTDQVPSKERDEAIALANRLLDEPFADPDDDLRTLARQFLRAVERATPEPPVTPRSAIPFAGVSKGVNYEALANATYPERMYGGDVPSKLYTIEPHGDGHALYSGRDQWHHGFNLARLTEATPETVKLIEQALNAGAAQPPRDGQA